MIKGENFCLTQMFSGCKLLLTLHSRLLLESVKKYFQASSKKRSPFLVDVGSLWPYSGLIC